MRDGDRRLRQTQPDGSTIETIIYSDGSRSVQFTPGPGTPGANQQTLQQQAQNALTGNRTYLGIASPTNAQTQALIRLALNQLDATN